MRCCYISRKFNDHYSAGNKAKSDMEAIMEDIGFRNIGLEDTRRKGKAATFFAVLAGVLKGVASLRRGDVLLLQYPLKKYYTFICRMAHMKGARVITLVHDLGSFRRHKLTPRHEVRRLSNSDFIIALNPSMQQWLRDNGCAVPSTSLGVWDFLSPSSPSVRALGDNPVVVYAGALGVRKNRFLYAWGPLISGFRANLYGWGFDPAQAERPDAIDVKGFKLADELIATAEGQFGLVWDGDSTSTCSGAWGEYLRYNNPHKTSLYLRCHLPLIVWKEAAMAPFVLDNGIGIAVDSLEEIPARLAAVTPESYDAMMANVIRVSDRIARGAYFREAVSRALAVLNPSC